MSKIITIFYIHRFFFLYRNLVCKFEITINILNLYIQDLFLTSDEQAIECFMTKIGHSAIWGFPVKKAAFSCQIH